LKNVCTIYDTACLYNLSNLKQHSAQFIDNHANEIIKTTEFLNLSAVSFDRNRIDIYLFNNFYQNLVQSYNVVTREPLPDIEQVHL